MKNYRFWYTAQDGLESRIITKSQLERMRFPKWKIIKGGMRRPGVGDVTEEVQGVNGTDRDGDTGSKDN